MSQLNLGTDKISPKDISAIYKIKDSAIFLGVLYAIGFLVMLPVYLNYLGKNTITILELLFISFIVIVGIHFLFNWLYYFVVILPFVAATTFFIAGWVIHIFGPVLETYIHLIIQPLFVAIDTFPGLGGSFGGSMSQAISSILNPLFKVLDRIGDLLIFVGGIFWWLVSKGKDIKYKALAFYLVFLAFVGALLGIGNMTNVFFFLFIWYLLYLKVQGLEDVKDVVNLSALFKIGATLVIVGGIAGVEVAGSGLDTVLRFSSGNPNSIITNLSKIYPRILGILLLIGVWKPTIYKKYIPKLFVLLKWLEGKSVYLLKWR